MPQLLEERVVVLRSDIQKQRLKNAAAILLAQEHRSKASHSSVNGTLGRQRSSDARHYVRLEVYAFDGHGQRCHDEGINVARWEHSGVIAASAARRGTR